MASNFKLPDRTINYRVYLEGNRLLGIATVDLPEINYMTETLNGAGVAGQLETPLQGHIDSMTMTLNFVTPVADAVKLLEAKAHSFILRAALQTIDGADNSYGCEKLAIAVRGYPKNFSLGSLEMNAQTGTSMELEISYLKIDRDDKTELEIDKINFIYKVGDTNFLDSVSSALGM